MTDVAKPGVGGDDSLPIVGEAAEILEEYGRINVMGQLAANVRTRMIERMEGLYERVYPRVAEVLLSDADDIDKFVGAYGLLGLKKGEAPIKELQTAIHNIHGALQPHQPYAIFAFNPEDNTPPQCLRVGRPDDPVLMTDVAKRVKNVNPSDPLNVRDLVHDPNLHLQVSDSPVSSATTTYLAFAEIKGLRSIEPGQRRYSVGVDNFASDRFGGLHLLDFFGPKYNPETQTSGTWQTESALLPSRELQLVTGETELKDFLRSQPNVRPTSVKNIIDIASQLMPYFEEPITAEEIGIDISTSAGQEYRRLLLNRLTTEEDTALARTKVFPHISDQLQQLMIVDGCDFETARRTARKALSLKYGDEARRIYQSL